VYHDGRLFVLHLPSARAMKQSGAATLQALDPPTGRELWRYDKATQIAYIEWHDVFAIGDTVWLPDRKVMNLVGLDAATGNEKKVHSIRKALDVGHHHRCYPNRACRSGHVLGNGLFYRSPDHCQCYMSFQPRGYLAMSSSKAPITQPTSDLRLIKGPAYKQIDNRKPAIENPTDWPTFRHDAMRSSMATSPIPSAPKRSWQTKLNGTLCAPTIAGGKVFVASEDTHQVIALDAATGKRAWAFTTGGRVDSPPTVWQGCVLFGSRGGRVYCLRATDGELVWQFNAAPDDRRIVAFGQLESCWPVCGSVLVAGGTAYFVAGRTSLLDGGVCAYALDVASGKILDTQHMQEMQTETKTTGQLPEGALSDILTTDGESVYLRKRKLGLAPAVKDVQPQQLAAIGPTLVAEGGFANRRWFHRAFWHLDSRAANGKGNLIAFDNSRAYVAAANLPGSPNQTFHIPAGGITDRIAGLDGDGPSWLANPNVQIGGTILFATASRADKRRGTTTDPRGPQVGKRQRLEPAIWRHFHFPLYPWAMVVGQEHLAVAGPPAEIQPDDPWANFEGRAGGELQILDKKTGEPIARVKLSSPPVWNGMAAARGRLYLSTLDGRLLSLE
jgi:outer membrane protein assembly factor BamB